MFSISYIHINILCSVFFIYGETYLIAYIIENFVKTNINLIGRVKMVSVVQKNIYKVKN